MKTAKSAMQVTQMTLLVCILMECSQTNKALLRPPTQPPKKPAVRSLVAKSPVKGTVAPPAPNKLLYAVCMVESSGGTNPKANTPNSCGAVGPLQIRPCVLEDLKSFKGLRYTVSDCLDMQKSVRMFEEYTSLWIARKGLTNTDENRARIWYGGPNGPTITTTLGYWHKVQQYM